MPSAMDFSADRHARFAALSGDYNPMHMDAVAARRTLAGAPVVHGVHTLLWALDAIAGQRPELQPASALKAQFRKMVYVGDRVELAIVSESESALRARGLVDGIEVLSLAISFGAPHAAPAADVLAAPAAMPPPANPQILSLEQIAGRSGRMQFATSPAEIGQAFPHAARYLGIERVAALACASCLVGMVVPGLHSLFAGLELRFEDETRRAGALDYAVTLVDERFRLVRLSIQGANLSGSLDTVCRPPPVAQPSMASVGSLVAADEFLGATALIVGGSRGLGEVAAKLISAGGGHVIVTYLSGKADAAAVAAEIRHSGGHCEIVQYDATRAAALQLAVLPQVPTHIYYFATPPIARRKSGLCDPRRLEEFNAYYLTGFLDLAQAALRLRPDGVKLFYPSTVYVDSRPADLTEYAMAKAAGEVLCADMQKYLKGIRVLARRLPRLSTDQTSSIVPVETGSAVEVMLPIVREMQRADRGAEL